MEQFITEAINDPLVLLMAVPALLVAFNEFLKKMGMNDRWCPLVNLLGGLIALPFLLQMGSTWFSGTLLSFAIGLSAGGFYDFSQSLKRG